MTNYRRGVRAEYLMKHDLEALGWTVLRMAGSHGAFDLVAIKPGHPVRLIQVKSGSAALPERPLPESTCSAYVQELWVRQRGSWHQAEWKARPA